MSQEPDIDGRTPRRFPEPAEDLDDDESNLDDLTIDDFDTSAPRSSEPSLLTQIEGNLDLETQLLRYLDQGLSPEEAAANSRILPLVMGEGGAISSGPKDE